MWYNFVLLLYIAFLCIAFYMDEDDLYKFVLNVTQIIWTFVV